MIRMSAIRNTPVVIGQKTIGILQSISVDMVQKRVYALNVSCGLKGRYMVVPEDILSISDGFILASGLVRYRQDKRQTYPRFVRDSTGLLVGRVTDYAISEDDLRLNAIEMQIGLLGGERRIRIWIIDYTCSPDKSELIVPVSLGSELIYSVGGMSDAYFDDEGHRSRKFAWHDCRSRADDDASRKTNETRSG